MPVAGTVYPLATPLPAALVADEEAALAAEEATEDAEEAMLLAAPDAEVMSEEAAEVALLTTLFSAELALDAILLIRLERLLKSEPVAVAATDDKLATSDEADAEIVESRDSTDETKEVAASDEANDWAEDAAEAAFEVAVPKAEVASLTTADASEVAAETIELTS